MEVQMNSARSLLTAVAALAGVAEIGMAIQFALDADSSSAPAPAAVFAAAFLLLAWLVHAGKFWPVIALVALFAIEVAFIPFYKRSTWVDWAEHGGFLAISVVGLIVGFAVVAERKRITT
jgi:hypothetical protein